MKKGSKKVLGKREKQASGTLNILSLPIRFTKNFDSMELEILESQKGTRVVLASELHLALRISNHNYGANLRKWLRDAYEFRDGIRRPEPLRDFAKKPMPNQPVDDYYLTLELAKLISLRTNSKEKMKYARYLDIAANYGQMSLFQQAAAA